MSIKKQTNHIGVHYKKEGVDVTAGSQPLNFKNKPINAQTNKRHTETVFTAINAGEPKEPNGDMVSMTIEVLGGMCGREKMCLDRDNAVLGEHAADKNLVVDCQAVTLTVASGQVEEPFNFEFGCPGAPEDDEPNVPNNIGDVIIKNLGSTISKYGWPPVGGGIELPDYDADQIEGEPIALDQGDWVYWGIGLKNAIPDGLTGGQARWKELQCDCSGIPQWYAEALRRNPDADLGGIFDDGMPGYTWEPCNSGVKPKSTGYDPVPMPDVYDRTYWCSGVVWMGCLKPGESTVYPLAPDSGVTLKFIAGPGFYTRMVNAGMPFNGLYRSCRQPKAEVKLTLFPETNV